MRRALRVLLALLALASAAIAGGEARYVLTATDGSRVSDLSFAGKWQLLYFGYTFCPDACPTMLAEVARALEALGPHAAEVRPIFITIDPHRDTTEVMAAYVKAFDPRILGLTGTQAEIARAARAFNVFYERDRESDLGDGAYLMNHSSRLFLLDPRGVLIAALPGTATAEQIAARLRDLAGWTP